MNKLIFLSLITTSIFANQITVSGISSGAYMAQQFRRPATMHGRNQIRLLSSTLRQSRIFF